MKIPLVKMLIQFKIFWITLYCAFKRSFSGDKRSSEMRMRIKKWSEYWDPRRFIWQKDRWSAFKVWSILINAPYLISSNWRESLKSWIKKKSTFGSEESEERRNFKDRKEPWYTKLLVDIFINLIIIQLNLEPTSSSPIYRASKGNCFR